MNKMSVVNDIKNEMLRIEELKISSIYVLAMVLRRDENPSTISGLVEEVLTLLEYMNKEHDIDSKELVRLLDLHKDGYVLDPREKNAMASMATTISGKVDIVVTEVLSTKVPLCSSYAPNIVNTVLDSAVTNVDHAILSSGLALNMNEALNINIEMSSALININNTIIKLLVLSKVDAPDAVNFILNNIITGLRGAKESLSNIHDNVSIDLEEYKGDYIDTIRTMEDKYIVLYEELKKRYDDISTDDLTALWNNTNGLPLVRNGIYQLKLLLDLVIHSNVIPLVGMKASLSKIVEITEPEDVIDVV